jgi:hypothetical protein
MAASVPRRESKWTQVVTAIPCARLSGMRIKHGKAAELIFTARCLIEGLDCFTPVTDDGRVDVLVGRSFQRCQVKTMNSGALVLRKTGANSRSNVKMYRYTSVDVDFMVGVTLNDFGCYIVPLKEVESEYRNSITVKVLDQRGYRNNFALLHGSVG